MVYRKLVFGLGLSLAIVGLASNTSSASSDGNSQGRNYLYAWSGDADKAAGDKDFLATIDVNESSGAYGQVVSTAQVNEVGTMPHHLEPTVSSDNTLYTSAASTRSEA